MKGRPLLLLALGLLLSAGLARLGAWQWQRAHDKEVMLAAVQAVLARRAPVPLATTSQGRGYAWAAGRGRFLPGPVLLLDNQRRGERVGVQVLAPFQPEDGTALLVELGWLPLPPERTMPSPAIPAGSLEISGLLVPPPSPGLALGADHVVQDGHWLLTRVDLPALAVAMKQPLASRVLRLDPALPVGFARDLDVLPNTLPPERHRGYALQWFGLSATLLAISLFLFVRRRP